MSYYFDYPAGSGLIALWRDGRRTEIANFTLAEARKLRRSLDLAIEELAVSEERTSAHQGEPAE